jgi:diadenosine tetraphosphatase ApaH/serine/threonine PP2A family protein phosphatase
VESATDARVGRRAGHDEAADLPGLQQSLEVGVLKRVAITLVDEWLGVVALELVDVLPVVAALDEVVVGVLDPDHRRVRRPGPVHERVDVGDHAVALVGVSHDTALHVDDEERRVGTVRQRGHDPYSPRPAAVAVATLVRRDVAAGPGV